MLNLSYMKHGLARLASKPELLTSSPTKLIFFFFLCSPFPSYLSIPMSEKGSQGKVPQFHVAMWSDLLRMDKLCLSWKL